MLIFNGMWSGAPATQMALEHESRVTGMENRQGLAMENRNKLWV
jgi:hypothetical protein